MQPCQKNLCFSGIDFKAYKKFNYFLYKWESLKIQKKRGWGGGGVFRLNFLLNYIRCIKNVIEYDTPP